MAVPQPNGKSAALEPGRQVHDAEHTHAVCRYSVFFPDYSDLPEAERFNPFLNHLDVGNGFVWRPRLPVTSYELSVRPKAAEMAAFVLHVDVRFTGL